VLNMVLFKHTVQKVLNHDLCHILDLCISEKDYDT
jgi:hypothetical protein